MSSVEGGSSGVGSGRRGRRKLIHTTSMGSSEPPTTPTRQQKQWSTDGKWYIGQTVEAQDNRGIWYPAKVREFENGQMKIHFQRWR